MLGFHKIADEFQAKFQRKCHINENKEITESRAEVTSVTSVQFVAKDMGDNR